MPGRESVLTVPGIGQIACAHEQEGDNRREGGLDWSLRLVTNAFLLFLESTVELELERGGIRLPVGSSRGSLRLRRSWQ